MEDHHPTPCDGRDEWTRDPNHMTDKTPAEQAEDAEATMRAQLTCYTRCPVREQCFQKAMAFGEDNDWFVWGGYAGWERARIREHGPLPVPATAAKFQRPNMDRINMLLDSSAPYSVLAEHWGISVSAVANSMRGYLWMLRVSQGDIGVKLHVNSLPESTDRVRAA